MAILVTDPGGGALAGIHVEVLGASDRSGDSNKSGQVNLTGMQAGSYRVRFSGDGVITYEREIAIRAGRVADVDVTLNPAPPPAPAPSAAPPVPAAPAAAPVGPTGAPQMLSIVDLLARELIGNGQARRDTLLACSGTLRTTIVQLNQDQEDRQYDAADITYYVVAGEGTLKLKASGRETPLTASSFVAIPRGTAHAVLHKGRRPLVMLVALSGVPCEEAR
jgi:mannose-6-phosphate isomerase-like protein (cupin superfamily)